MMTFSSIILLWPSTRAFADAIGVKLSTATNMLTRDSIAAEHFDVIVSAAADLGRSEVTHEMLCKIARQKKNTGKSGRFLEASN